MWFKTLQLLPAEVLLLQNDFQSIFVFQLVITGNVTVWQSFLNCFQDDLNLSTLRGPDSVKQASSFNVRSQEKLY